MDPELYTIISQGISLMNVITAKVQQENHNPESVNFTRVNFSGRFVRCSKSTMRNSHPRGGGDTTLSFRKSTTRLQNLLNAARTRKASGNLPVEISKHCLSNLEKFLKTNVRKSGARVFGRQ